MEKKIEDQIFFNEANQHKFILENLALGIIFQDKDCKILYANPAALKIFNLTQEQIRGKTSLSPDILIIQEDGSVFPKEALPYSKALSLNQKIENSIMGILNPKLNQISWVKIQAIPLSKIGEDKPYGVYTTWEDITSKKMIEDRERQNALNLQRAHADLLQRQFAIDQHAIVAVTDYQGNITYANEKFCKISKYKDFELIGQNHRIVNSGYHSRYFFQELYKTINAGEIWHGEIRNKAKDGSYYWVHTTIVPLKSMDGDIQQFISIRTDITEQKRIQEELKFSEAKIKALFTNSPQSLLLIDKNRKIQFFNQIASERSKLVFGRELKIGDTIYDFVLKEDRHQFDLDFEATLLGQTLSVEKAFKVNEIDYWFEFQFAPVKNNSDEIVGILFSSNDINSRKQIEQRLAENEFKFRTIFEEAPTGIALVNSMNNTPLQLNRKFCEILGYSETELLNTNWNSFIIPEDLVVFQENINRLNRGIIKLFSMEIRYIRKDQTLIWTHLTCVPLWQEKDSVRLNLRILLDITDRKKNEADIKRYMQELEKLNHTKDKFFSIIAHDLRNPFAGIIGISELLEARLKDEEIPDKSELLKFPQMISTASKSAFNLLENLMQWSKSQRGEIAFNPNHISLKKIIDSTIPIISSSAFNKNISIEFDLDENDSIYADEALVSTVLRNLLTNSIKFTHSNGKVKLSTREVNNYLEISVIDTGVGIDDKNLERIFRIDSKFSKPGTENERGTGLGLILCKEFVEIQGGNIWVESIINVGSKFTFTLPLAK